MGAMKNLFLQRQELPEIQEKLAIEDLLGHHCEPDFPETRDFMTEPIDGTVFDTDLYIPF